MVYLIGVIGFIVGFFVGQMLLVYSLRDSDLSNKELMEDRALRLKYGIFNWLIAASLSAVFIKMYNYYFF